MFSISIAIKLCKLKEVQIVLVKYFIASGNLLNMLKRKMTKSLISFSGKAVLKKDIIMNKKFWVEVKSMTTVMTNLWNRSHVLKNLILLNLCC